MFQGCARKPDHVCYIFWKYKNVNIDYFLQDNHLNLRVYREEDDDVDQETWEAVVTLVKYLSLH